MVFWVELEGAPFYFSIREQPRAAAAPQVFAGVPERHRCYSLLVCSRDPVKRVKLHAELRGRLLSALPPDCHVCPMSSFLPNVNDSVIRGYFLTDRSGSPDSSERLLRDLQRQDPVHVCSYSRGEGGQVWTQHPWSPADSQTTNKSKTYYVMDAEAPKYHPSTLSIINSEVFYRFEEAREVLEKVFHVS